MSSSFPVEFGRSLALMLLEIRAELEDFEFQSLVESAPETGHFVTAEGNQALTSRSADFVCNQPLKRLCRKDDSYCSSANRNAFNPIMRWARNVPKAMIC